MHKQQGLFGGGIDLSQVMVEQSVFSYLKEHEQEMLEDLVGFVKKNHRPTVKS